jgi:hypothetical protein
VRDGVVGSSLGLVTIELRHLALGARHHSLGTTRVALAALGSSLGLVTIELRHLALGARHHSLGTTRVALAALGSSLGLETIELRHLALGARHHRHRPTVRCYQQRSSTGAHGRRQQRTCAYLVDALRVPA